MSGERSSWACLPLDRQGRILKHKVYLLFVGKQKHSGTLKFCTCWLTFYWVALAAHAWSMVHIWFLNQVAGVEYWHSKSCSRSRVNSLSICILFGLSVDHIKKVGKRFFTRDRGQSETTNWQPHQVEPELKLKRSNTYELFLKKNLYLKLFWTLPESLQLNLSIKLSIYNSGLCRPEPHPLLLHHRIYRNRMSNCLFVGENFER